MDGPRNQVLGQDPAEPTILLRTIAVKGRLTTFVFGQDAALRRLE